MKSAGEAEETITATSALWPQGQPDQCCGRKPEKVSHATGFIEVLHIQEGAGTLVPAAFQSFSQ